MAIWMTRRATLAPGAETWTRVGDDVLVAVSAAGITAPALECVDRLWHAQDATYDALATAAQVSYCVSDAMPRGVLARLVASPGRVLGTLDAAHVHPATAAALGRIAQALLAVGDDLAAAEAS